MEGKKIDILKLAKPMRLASPFTNVTCLANDFNYTSLLLKAAEQN